MNTTTAKNIDAYIKNFSPDVQKKLQEIRTLIKAEVPEAVEAISYAMPTFKLNGKNLVHFAGFKNHIGFYPLPSGVAELKKMTQDYATSKGTVQFPLDQAIPTEIVKKIVRFRVNEIIK